LVVWSWLIGRIVPLSKVIAYHFRLARWRPAGGHL